MAFFDDFDRQVVEMMRTLEHYPMFGRAEPLLEYGGNAVSRPASSSSSSSSAKFPFLRARMDLVETPKSFKVYVELPGVRKEDIKVSIDDSLLTVEAEQSESIKRDEGDRYHYSERRFGTIKRSVNVPPACDTAKVRASFQNGLLELEMEKTQKESAKTITID